MGGKPSKGTKKDKRLKRNNPKAGTGGKKVKKPFGKGNKGDGKFPI